jgi:hypothetical protein
MNYDKKVIGHTFGRLVFTNSSGRPAFCLIHVWLAACTTGGGNRSELPKMTKRRLIHRGLLTQNTNFAPKDTMRPKLGSILTRVARCWFLKSQFWVNIGWSWNGNEIQILWPFGLFYGHLVYVIDNWYILGSFGALFSCFGTVILWLSARIWCFIVDIASASGTEDPGSYPARVYGFRENIAMLAFIISGRH